MKSAAPTPKQFEQQLHEQQDDPLRAPSMQKSVISPLQVSGSYALNREISAVGRIARETAYVGETAQAIAEDRAFLLRFEAPGLRGTDLFWVHWSLRRHKKG